MSRRGEVGEGCGKGNGALPLDARRLGLSSPHSFVGQEPTVKNSSLRVLLKGRWVSIKISCGG